jgi:hypothetical protein
MLIHDEGATKVRDYMIHHVEYVRLLRPGIIITYTPPILRDSGEYPYSLYHEL